MSSTGTKQTETISRHTRRSFVKLAAWQLRQTWFLLLVTGIGIVCSVVIVCAVPLLSDVMTTAGLQGVLNASPANSELVLDASSLGPSTQTTQAIQQQLGSFFQRDIG